MNNKGFTLIELLVAIIVVTIVTIISFSIVGNTFSITDEKAYEIFEKNIITQTKNYILECDNGLIDCDGDYIWETLGNTKKTSFNLEIIKKYNYFNAEDFIDPVSKKDVSGCLLIEVSKDELYNVTVEINNKKC